MRVLIIEDNDKLRQSLTTLFSSEGWSVDAHADGQEGYEAAGVEEYDVILLDIGLPSMDGVTIAQTLRAEGVATPILMLTARDAIPQRIEGLNVGADDYVVKPFDIGELLARVRALVRRASNPTPVYTVDSLTLDPAKKRVERDGAEIALSAKEYALLEYLIMHKGHILSKQQLLDHVWGSDVDPFSNVIDVYIGYLRKKVDKHFPTQQPLLHTVKGLGYKLG